MGLPQFLADCFSLQSIICGPSKAFLLVLVLHDTFILGLFMTISELLPLLPLNPFFLLSSLFIQSINRVDMLASDGLIIVIIIISSCISPCWVGS